MDYDLIIIGAGPGGYVAAIRAGQTGLKTALIEKDELGGMCLNWGCVPTKVLLECAKRLQAVKHAADFGIDGIDENRLTLNWPAMVKRTNRIVKRLTGGIKFLLKKNGVTVIKGTAVINKDKSVSVENQRLTAKNLIIATGSRPMKANGGIPADAAVEVANLMKLDVLPQTAVVLGNGPHAVELAQFFKLADRTVTLVTLGTELIPEADPFLSGYALEMLKKSGVTVELSARVTGYKDGELILETGADDKKTGKRIPCEKVIAAAERCAILPESEVKLKTENGFLAVNDELETSAANIYAVGDVNGRSMFAHAASAQGLYAVDRINGINREPLFELNRFPINIYTHPEMAQVGLTQPHIKQLKIRHNVGEFPMSANAKALAEGESEGLVRILSDKKYGEVLGVQIIASHATDMIAEASLMLQMEGTVFDLAQTVHAHPTTSEVFMEAGFDAFGQPVHK